MREVDEKRARWRAQPEDKEADFLGSHFIPVVLGPGKKPYPIDHHHLARALYDEGVEAQSGFQADISPRSVPNGGNFKPAHNPHRGIG
jgi:hypothetical protein